MTDTSDRVAVVVLALDEAERILPTLTALTAVGVEALVVDGGSTDGTPEVVRSAGHECVTRTFDGFSAQRNWAMVRSTKEYVLFVDADEVVTPELWRDVLAAVEMDCDAGWIPTLDYFAGRWMLHGGWYPQPHLRLLKRTSVRFEGDVHEEARFLVEDPRIATLDHPLVHRSHITLSHYLRKLDRYTEIEAGSRTGSPWLLVGRGCTEGIAVLVHRLVVRQGWRDGPQGVVGAVSYAFYRFTIWAKAATATSVMDDTTAEAQRVWRRGGRIRPHGR